MGIIKRQKCVIYYAVVKGKSERVIEPVKIFRREPIGKEPEFCCEEIMKSLDRYDVCFVNSVLSIGRTYEEIHFCPFCGAKVEYIHHLNLVEKQTKVGITEYYYEVSL